MDRINTTKTLHNSYFDGDKYDQTFNVNTPIAVNSMVADQYDYAVTDNPELLNDRKNSAELIHKIFTESIYNDGRFEVKQREDIYSVEGVNNSLIKIPKENIAEVFNYVKTELLKQKNLNPIELIIAINEFFDFNYDYVYKKVLTPKMKQEILEDYYKNEGMHERMQEGSSIKLF